MRICENIGPTRSNQIVHEIRTNFFRDVIHIEKKKSDFVKCNIAGKRGSRKI